VTCVVWPLHHGALAWLAEGSRAGPNSVLAGYGRNRGARVPVIGISIDTLHRYSRGMVYCPIVLGTAARAGAGAILSGREF